MEIDKQFYDEVQLRTVLAEHYLWKIQKQISPQDYEIYCRCDEYRYLRLYAASGQLLTLSPHRSIFTGLFYKDCQSTYFSMLRRAGIPNMVMDIVQAEIENFYVMADEYRSRRADLRKVARSKIENIGIKQNIS